MKLKESLASTAPGEIFGLELNPSESYCCSGICFRIIPNQSEKCFVSRLMKKGQKSIRLNPSIGINTSSNWLEFIRVDASD